MKVFTYNDYIKAIHSLRLNEVFRVAEESAKYQLKEETKDKSYDEDKLIKAILSDEEEMKKFIKGFISKNEKFKKGDLEKYKIKKYKAKEPDIIYKLKSKEKYYIVEYLQENDDGIEYRILNYCIDIIYEWSKSARVRNDTKYPIIVPIVIYTGDKKWKKERKDKSIGNYVIENYKIDIEYNLIELNKLSKEFLSKQEGLFAHEMLMKKMRKNQ